MSGHPILDHADIQEAARPGDGVGFLEALGSCRTLTCLRDAHNRPKQPGQFNFPHALIIGWQKSATTSLYAHLDRHPDVIASENKEPEFFTVKCKDDPVNGCPVGQQAWYIERTLQRDAFIAAGGQAMAFEASTHYAMNGDLLADGVAQTMPWVKVIASLREPISRATSMLVHMLDIEKTGCLKQENPDLFTCLTTDSQLVGHPGPFNYLDSLEGSYAKPLQHWLDAFPRDQIRVLQYEVLIGLDTADQQLTEVKSFLGLDPALPKGRAGLDKHNLRKNSINPDGWPMRKEQYQQLIDMVRPDAER